MLARVPVDAQGQFPINSHLISALATGFLYFNQLLFWGLAELLEKEETQRVLFERFGWLSGGTALVVWLVVLSLQLREQAARASDFVVLTLVLGAHVLAFRTQPPSLLCMASANALLLLWSARGLLRQKSKPPGTK